MKDILYNGVGFNAEWAKKVGIGEFIHRHSRLWPGKPKDKVEKDLRQIFEKLTGQKADAPTKYGSREKED